MTSSDGLFTRALARRNDGRPPVWFMRQAGRYHAHYQRLRAMFSFMELCKRPDVACEVTLGPIEDFGFDAAILFSDLLFPLEAMGTGLKYEPGPQLERHLRAPADLARLGQGVELAATMTYQGEAMRRIRAKLAPETGLLGFVGGPLTLYCYAVEGGHQGALESARAGMGDGRYDGFCEKLLTFLPENMADQARGGADVVAVLDTCAGEFDPRTYRERVVPVLRELLRRYHALGTGVPVLYYSKGTTAEHWRALDDVPGIAGLGIDWRTDIRAALEEFGDRYAIQGNVDPAWLHLPPVLLGDRLREWFLGLAALRPELRRGWICGLGHGVQPLTPEENVRTFLRLQKEILG